MRVAAAAMIESVVAEAPDTSNSAMSLANP